MTKTSPAKMTPQWLNYETVTWKQSKSHTQLLQRRTTRQSNVPRQRKTEEEREAGRAPEFIVREPHGTLDDSTAQGGFTMGHRLAQKPETCPAGSAQTAGSTIILARIQSQTISPSPKKLASWLKIRIAEQRRSQQCSTGVRRPNHGLCGSNKLLYKLYAKSMGKAEFWPPITPKVGDRSFWN